MSTKPSALDQVLELLWYVPVYFAIKWFGWVYGIAGLILVFYVIGKILGKWFGLQFASGMDTYWLCDDERNYCNIIGFIRIEKFKAQEVKNQLFEKTTQFTRNRSKLVKFLGTWWYKEIPMEDMIKQKDKLIQLRDGIHNEKQLAEFMAKEQSIRDPIDNVQWRSFLIEDYTPTESVFIYKCHHVLADGIALMLNLANICDNPDPKTFPVMALRFPFWKRVLIHICVPFMILIITFQQFLVWRKERNGLKSDRIHAQMSSLKNIAFCHDIPIDVVKKRCAELGVTINEFIFGIISQTMKHCLEFHNDTTTRQIRCAIPFSLRPPPTHATDFELRNDFAILPVEMRLVSDLKTEIKQIQRDLAHMKTSPMPVGWYYISYFVLSLPYQCFKFLTDDLADKLSMGFSNVPGSREDWFITGKRMIAQGFSIPLGKTVPMGWAAISHKDNIKICVNSDKASVQDIEWLMNKFETNLDDFLGSKEWRSFDPGQKK